MACAEQQEFAHCDGAANSSAAAPGPHNGSGTVHPASTDEVMACRALCSAATTMDGSVGESQPVEIMVSLILEAVGADASRAAAPGCLARRRAARSSCVYKSVLGVYSTDWHGQTGHFWVKNALTKH
eukprot:COSAG01_NODE_2793_length_7060_cov_5.562563_3_plen_127_part_00